MPLLNKYDELVRNKSDINEHLPTLFRYASLCRHITEFWVRTGLSDFAILAGMDKDTKFIAYDINTPPTLRELKLLAHSDWKTYNFNQWDTKKIEIEPTDMLFIDTLHDYDLLKVELERHAHKVRKYILFHDTKTFGDKGETKWHLWLNKAIKEYQKEHPERVTKEIFTNNNWLTILERIEVKQKKMKKKSKSNITVYTAIYWKIDKLKKQPEQNIPVDFVCFTDDPNIECEPGAREQWDIRIVNTHPHLHPRMQAKYLRTHPYDYLDTEIVMRIDWSGRLLNRDSVNHLVSQYLDKSDVLTFQHPERNCIVDEMEFCLVNEKAQKKYRWLPIRQQVEWYLKNWMPKKYGLTWTGLQITKKNNKKVRKFFDDWRRECLERTYQDQLSYDYLVWRDKIKRQWLQENQRNNEYISFTEPHLHLC